MADNIVRIASAPGIKRDGTKFEGDNYVDGRWVRFQRGLPRKMGGYRAINKYLQGLVRSLYVYTQNQLTYVHAGSADLVERFYNRGFEAGRAGRSRGLCPMAQGPGRDAWLSGWRDGRTAAWDGLTGVSGIHCDPRRAS